MLGNLIELQFGRGRNRLLGASLSLTLLVIVTVALLTAFLLLSRKRRDDAE